jgi:hypothetical protein
MKRMSSFLRLRRMSVYTFKDGVSIAANARLNLVNLEGEQRFRRQNRMFRASVEESDMRMETTAQLGAS